MKNLKENYFAKLIMVITVIFTMLFSSIAPIISLAAGDTGSNEDEGGNKINFDVKWGNNGQSINCSADQEVVAVFNLELKGVRTGFNNLKIKVEDTSKPRAMIDAKKNNTSNSLVDVSKSNSSTLVFKSKVDSGIGSGGTIAISFPRAADFQNYNKQITFTLTGDYADPSTGETQYVQIVKTLDATVSTNPEVSTFSFDGDLINSNGNSLVSKTTSTSGVNGPAGEWYATNLYLNIPATIGGTNVTYGKYEYTIGRTASLSDMSRISSEENCSVQVNGLPEYVTYDVERNNDGTIKVIITVGEDKEEYQPEDVFDFSANFSIKVFWKVVEDTSRGTTETTAYSRITVYADGNTKGYTITRSATGTDMDAKSSRTTDNYSKNESICYYVGEYAANTTISSSSMPDSQWAETVDANNGDVDLVWYTECLYWDHRPEEQKEQLRVNSYRSDSTTNLRYRKSDGNGSYTYETVDLENDELTLKSLTVSGFDYWAYVDFYKKGEDQPFFRAEPGNNTFTVPDGEVITDYYAVFAKIYSVARNSTPSWEAKYTLHTSKLTDRMSEEDIKNIRDVTRYQQGFFGSTEKTGVSSAAYTIYTPSPIQRYSYFEMSSRNMNSAVADYGVTSSGSITLSMYKNTEVMNRTTNLRNQNPKFFIALPKCFDYENMKVTVDNAALAISNEGCTDENEQAWYIDQETGYLVINCFGDWYYDTNGRANINISFSKRLNTYNVKANNKINAYMITDNECYIGNVASNNGLSKNGVTPANVGYATTSYTITLDDNVKVRNGLIVNENEIYPTATSDDQLGTFENPVLVRSGETVQYKTELAANGFRLNNIEFVCRLPKQNNNSIIGDTYSLNSENSLINLNEDIAVKVSGGGSEVALDSSRYTIYYSTNDNCTFDSEWTAYTSGDANIANAKSIKIKLDENYTLSTSGFLNVYFKMEMPSTEGISGQISAVRFKRNGVTDVIELEPAAVYVTKGIPEGGVNIQKVFEGYRTGVAPAGLSLQDIEFKIKNVKTGEILVIQGQTDSEGKVRTDSTGKATVTGIPRGKYQVIEVSQLTGYEATDYVTFEIKNGETKNVTVTNHPVSCELTIHKQWKYYNMDKRQYEDLSKQQGSVTVKIMRQGDSISFTRTVSTNATTGEATLFVPYGSYIIQEITGADGWTSSPINSRFDVKQEHVDYTIINTPQLCGLTIEKTVPNTQGSTDTVNGIKLKVEGTAYADSYIDNNGERQEVTYEKTITIGEEIEGVTQTISEDGKKATLNLGTVYAGNYTITEIDTPTIEIDGQNVSKYIDLVRTVSLNASTSNTIVLENVWKRAPVKIHKTAEEGVELDKFKFRIHGTSYYGTEVDVTLNTDTNGEARGNILLGNYVIEEVGTQAFNATYTMKKNGEDVTKADNMDFSIKDTAVININVNNETAYGYVKVAKSLEGIDDPSKAAGIKFQVIGLAPSGENISEDIVIGQDGTGISGPIPAGGEYILVEDADTVPDFFEVADDVEIDITKFHTEEEPLVVNVNDKRGRGNLEISTETNPEGGPLYPISYKVDEVDINEDTGAYTVIDGTTINLEGDLLGEASITNIPAGTYLVSQVSVPTGWKKDIPQIIDVPMNNTGYANFIIEQEGEIKNTEVRVSKTILNPEGNVATNEDFTKYKLNNKPSFEVKITNIETNKDYFVYMDAENEGVITGIPSGRYTIEEVYKPKYTTEAYNLVQNSTTTQIEAEDGKYYFELGTEQDGTNVVHLNIVNKINKDFGFGGQDSKDNLSHTDVESVVPEVITRTAIFVTDEEGNFIDGCTFDIYDSEGNKVAQIAPKTKIGTIKGLEPGQYTIKNSVVPDGYLHADDIKFTVYEDAVRAIRFEIQKNIPRGNLTLQTVYQTETGLTRNVAKSQYKVVNSETGEVVKFIRKADGSYARSNLSTATDTISLRAGKVTLRGVETGSYEVGLTGITDNYGLVDASDVEVVDIIENETQDIVVQTVKRTIVDIQAAYDQFYVLDSNGALWGWGYNGSSSYPVGTGDYRNTYEPTLLVDGGVKKMSIGYYSRAILMDDGTVFTWGYNNAGEQGSGNQTGTTLTDVFGCCVTDKIGCKAVDVSVGYRSLLILDENGKLWYSGDLYYCGLGYDRINQLYRENGNSSYITTPICLTDLANSPFDGIEAKKVFCGYNNMCAILDTDGRLWTFSGGNADVGYQQTVQNEYYLVTCVSTKSGNDIYEAYRNGTKIVDIDQCFAIDENGNVYAYGSNYSLPTVATSFTKAGGMLEGKKIKKAKAISGTTSSSNSPKFAFIDEDNKLYWQDTIIDNHSLISCYKDVEFVDFAMNYDNLVAVDKNNDLYSLGSYSYADYGQTGTDTNVLSFINGSYTQVKPFQVSLPNYAAYFKYDMKFQKVLANYYGAIALDEDGNLWSWGHGDSYSNYNATGNASGLVSKPRMIEFNEDIKFRDIEAVPNYYAMFAVDTDGRVWVWGYSSNNLNGIDGSSNYLAKTCISEIQGNPLAEAYANGIKIEEIKLIHYGLMVAKDNQNKIWIWGYRSTSYGSDNPTKPKCISDLEPIKSAIYDQGNYIKKYGICGDGLTLLDNEGNLYYLYNNELQTLDSLEDSELRREVVENGVSIVDFAATDTSLYILDSEGRVWKKGSWSASSEICLSTNENYAISNEYANGNKMVYINGAFNSYSIMGIDSNGHVWQHLNNSGDNQKCVATATKYKYVIECNSAYYAIDEDGYMWVWGYNYYGKLGIGISSSITINEPTITTGSARNTNLYGKKYAGVIAEGVEDPTGEVYRFGEYDISFNTQTTRYLTTRGVTIKQEEGNYVIDTDGKVYEKVSNRWTYPTEVEDSDLYNAYYNDNIKIEEIKKITLNGTTKTYFVDSNNHLWNTKYKQATDFEVAEFVTMAGSNTIVKDAEGNYYIDGSNQYGLLANGDLTVTSSDRFLKIVLNDESHISEILFFDGYNIYVKDQNDVVWAWGYNVDYASTGQSSSTQYVATPYSWGEQFQKICVQSFTGYSNRCVNVIALDVNGHVWSCGYGGSNTWPKGLLGKSSDTLGMVNNTSSMGTIVDITVATDCVYAINENGDLWVWGSNAFGGLGYATGTTSWYVDYNDRTKYYYTYSWVSSPVCVTNAQGTLRNKKIDKVINIGGYVSYVSETNKHVYLTGEARVLVVTQDGEVYKMGKNKIINSYCKDLFTNSATPYPQPELMNIDGNIIEWKYGNSKEVLLKTDTGAVYCATGTSSSSSANSESFYRIDNADHTDETLDEIYANRHKPSQASEKQELDIENHKIIVKSTSYYGVVTTKEFSYPDTIDAVSAYVNNPSYSNPTIYIVDSNGDLWIKGPYTGTGNTAYTFECVTQKEYLSEPIWNTIRGRWNVIYRKY